MGNLIPGTTATITNASSSWAFPQFNLLYVCDAATTTWVAIE